METVIVVLLCLGVAVLGAWESARCRHGRRGKLPEDIQ